MIPGLIAVAVMTLLITALVQRRHRGARPPGPVPARQFPARRQSSPERSWRRSARRRPAAARHRLRPDEERILAELDATWEPGYADRVAALLRPDADVDLPPP
jgi:hypothetical protein